MGATRWRAENLHDGADPPGCDRVPGGVRAGVSHLGNLLNVLRTISMLCVIAFGMTAVIIAGEIDLSVGAGVALAGCIVAWFSGALTP